MGSWGGYFFFDYSVKNQTCRISQREIRRGRCPARRPAEMATADLPKDSKPHRPVPFFQKAHRRGEHCSPETPQSSLRLASSSVEEPKEKSPLLEEMPGRAGGIYCPRHNSRNPSGGIRSFLAVRLWLANAFVCLFLCVQCWHSGCLFWAWFLFLYSVCHAKSLLL